MSRRVSVALAVAALAAAAAVLLAAALDRDPEAPSLRGRALPAAAFVDSIGVVTHFSYLDTAYARTPELLARLGELGVSHIREAAPPRTGPLADALRAARDRGIGVTVGSGDPASDPRVWVADSLAVAGDGVDAFEAPNELDNSGDPDWPAKLRAYMPRLASAVAEQAPGVPVIGPSFIDPASRSQVPSDLPGLFNAHPYPGAEPPEPSLDLALDERRAIAPERGVVFTETGFHNALSATTGQPPASEQAAAVYVPRLLATAFGAGVRRTFLYELVDEKPEPGLVDPEQHFGLLRNDLSPKPAFTAIQTMIAAVRGSGGRPPHSRPTWRLGVEGDEPVERLALARPDGSLAIAVWRPVSVWDRDARQPIDPGRVPVQLSFGGLGERDVEVWRPSVAPAPVLRRERTRQIELELAGDLVVVSVR